MVFSASYAYAYAQYEDSSYFIRRQLFFAGFGVIAMWGISKIHYKLIHKFSWAIFAGSTFLLVLVLFFGTADDEAKRWIDLKIFSFQPSEISKFALVLMIAWFAHRYRGRIMQRDGGFLTYCKSFLWGTIYTMLFVAGTCLLVLAENH